MQNKAAISKILIITVSLFIVSGLSISYYFLFSKANNENLNYIPENAIIKVRINGKSLASKTIENICLENPDSKLLIQLDTLIRQTLRSDLKKTGIDYLSEIGAFITKNEGKHNYFLVLNVDDKDEFNAYFSNSTNVNFTTNQEGNVGIVELGLDDFKKNNLNEFLKKESSFKFKEKDFSNDITIEGKGFDLLSKNGFFKLNCNFYADKISIDGNIQNTFNSFNNKFSLIKNGLHISVNEKNTLQNVSKLIQTFNPAFPELNHFEINYRGVSLTEGGNPYYAEPNFDLLIAFKNKIKQDSILSFVNKYKDFGFSYSNNKLSMGKSVYSLKVLNDTYLFISKNSKSVAQKSNDDIFEINGSPELLTKIKAPEYITSFFEMMSPYAASKSYLTSIKNINLKVTTNKFKTEITFKKNKNSFQELLKAVLIVKGIQ
jgi:hypothetical protein